MRSMWGVVISKSLRMDSCDRIISCPTRGKSRGRQRLCTVEYPLILGQNVPDPATIDDPLDLVENLTALHVAQ